MTGAATLTYDLEWGSAGLDRLQTEWSDVENACFCHPFQTHAYLSLWQREVGNAEGVRPLTVTARDGDVLVGIFPACFRVVRGMPAITWLSGPEMLDYGDILFRPGYDAAVVDAFVENALRLLAKASPLSTLYLTNVRADALAYPSLLKRLRLLKHSTAPYLTVTDSFSDYMAGRKHTLRSNLERKHRKMEREQDARLEVLHPGDPRIEETMDYLVRFQRVRFNKMTARTALHHKHQADFRVKQAMTHPDSRLFRIVWRDHIPAASLHAQRGDRLYNVTGGFDLDSSKYSPGSVLQRFAIESCFGNGTAVYDFCWGGESYKYDWASAEMPLATFTSGGVRGRVLSWVRSGSRRLALRFDELPDQK